MKSFLLSVLAALVIGTGAFGQTCKVTIKAPEGVSVEVYQGFGDSLKVGAPVSVTTRGAHVAQRDFFLPPPASLSAE